MLIRLQVTNFLLIKQLELDFASGLTVVTGETGSGKSIIIDALMLIFGARATTDIIRLNQQQAIFAAEFTLTNVAAMNWLAANDLTNLDDLSQVICRRIIDKNGKNKVYINGQVVTISQMRALGDLMLDIHTQHASITLLKPETQRKLLDEYAGITNQVEQLASLFKQIQEIKGKIQASKEQQQELELRQQLLQDKINDLSLLNLQLGEWEELELKHKELTNANVILQELDYANNLLTANDNSIVDNIAKLQTRLAKLTIYSPKFQDLATLLDTVQIELHELSQGIIHLVKNIEQDPKQLEQIEARINQVFALSRKYKLTPSEILPELSKLKQQLLTLVQDNNLEVLQEKLTSITTNYLEIANYVTHKRQEAANQLASKVTNLLHKLAINGEFTIQLLSQLNPASYGLEQIEYQVSFNKGSLVQPLAKVVSGGELSRTALALYLLLSVHNPPEIVIFDEIDVGIGGRVAAMVGQMLGELSQIKQVICITHQPQTASYANHHLLVSKNQQLDSTLTQVKYLESEARIKEIARMLGGMKITSATLKHAEEMLKMAAIPKNLSF